MTILYKVTDQNYKTLNDTQWGPNVTHGPTSGKGELCSSGWLHAYKSSKDAALMHKYHVSSFKNPILWEAEGTVEKESNDLKIGTRTLKTVKIIPFPEITSEDIDLYLDNKNSSVRYWVIKCSNATSENIDKGLNDKDWHVRVAAIYHANATGENIDKALDDENYFVREAAVSHPKATIEQIDRALSDENFFVRETAYLMKQRLLDVAYLIKKS